MEIDAHAVISECIVTDKVRVPNGATHHRAMLVRGADGELVATPLNLEP